MAGAYVRKAAYCRAESHSTSLNIGGRKSREAGVQPRCAEPVDAEVAAMTERHCHTHNHWRTASQTSKWQVRTYESETFAMQKAAYPRSVSAKGRGVESETSREARSR